MTILKRISLWLFLFFVATPVFCVDYVVQIACYYFPQTGAETYEYLKKTDGALETKTAEFDVAKRIYRVPSGDSEKLEASCKQQLADQKKALTKVMAVSHATSKATGDWFGTHYDVRDTDDEKRQQIYREVLKVFDTLETDIRFQNDITAGDNSDSETKSFLSHLKTIDSLKTPLVNMISHGTLVDFPRDDVTVLDNGKTIYIQTHGLAKNLLTETENRYSGRDEANYSTEPFRLIEEAVLRKVPEMNRLNLRKNISRALHTRMQGYEAPSLVYLIRHFAENNSKPENVINTNEEGRATHTIKVVDDKLVMTSIMNFKITLALPYQMRIGIVVSERKVTMDLSNGTFSPETITLTKFDYL